MPIGLLTRERRPDKGLLLQRTGLLPLWWRAVVRRHNDGGGGGEFVALRLPAPPVVAAPPAPDIRIELRRGATSVTVSWPVAGASDCATWLREWLR